MAEKDNLVDFSQQKKKHDKLDNNYLSDKPLLVF